MTPQKLNPIKNWFVSLFSPHFISKHLNDNEQKGYLNIPIETRPNDKQFLPVHFSPSNNRKEKITLPVLRALGGSNNIESYREIPNSRRIRLTLVNPNLIDNALLEELDVCMFIRIGKRIVHIIP